MHRSNTLVFLALLPIAGALPAKAIFPQAPTRPAVEKFEAILGDHKALQAEHARALSGAKTQQDLEERERAFGYAARLEPLVRRALDLARDRPEDLGALDALLWVLKKSSDGGEAIALIGDDHLGDPRVGAFFQLIPYSEDPAIEAMGREVLGANPSREARAEAGQFVVRSPYNRAMAERRRKAEAGHESRGEPDELILEAEALFATLHREYDVPESFVAGLREEADRELFEIRRLGVGMAAPDLQGVDLEGRPIKLSDHRGKVVLLNFWATWCGPCMAGVPAERELVRELEGRPFVLLGVNGDEERERALEVSREKGMVWRSFWDGGPPGPIARSWNVRGWPTYYVIDQEGVIRFKCVDHDERGIRDALDRLLEGKEGENREGE